MAGAQDSSRQCALERPVIIGIGCIAIAVCSSSPEFLQILSNRYCGFISLAVQPAFELDVEIVTPGVIAGELGPDADLSVHFNGRWILDRGDFHAELDTALCRGYIRQAASPYAIDAVFRILHSLLLAKQRGLLVHAASAVRNGRAFLFVGASGAGKTTICRLAPPDVTLLTDEISYLRCESSTYVACGTPFAGELGKPGENVYAPLATLYLLTQGPENRVDRVSTADAARALLECVLFFAHDSCLIENVFESACELVEKIPVRRLTFVPEVSVWEAIQ